jgi:hypothetical protein
MRLLLLLMALFVATVALHAQTRDSAALIGHVHDSQGAAVKAADVALHNPATGFERTARTNADGRYSFVGLPLTGQYLLTVKAAQFNPAERKNIELRAGETATVDFTLNVAGGETQVTVYGTAGGVQSDSNQISDRLDLRKLQNTPVLNNKLTSLALLDSSIRPSFTTGDVFTNQTLIVANGGGRRQTTYSIDNTTADDSWGRQTILTSLPFAAVQEFTVLTNASSAEYGRTSGSAINIVSKSGTNNFHGDFLGMGRPAFSEASAPLATIKAENTLAQGSGAFSGPVVRDRTHFLFSGEFNNQFRDGVITSPKAPGAIFTGNFRQTLFLARVDHQVSAGNKLSFRANLDRFSDTNPQDGVSGNNLPSTARTFTKRSYAAAISDTAPIGTRIINEARVQWQLASPITQFVPQFPGPQVSLAGVFTYGDSRFANLMNHQYEQADTLTFVAGHHLLKTGFDLIESSSGGFGQEFGSGFLSGQWAINNPAGCNYAALSVADVIASLSANPAAPPPQAVCTGAPPALVSSYTQSFGNQQYNIKEVLWAGFLQDDWKVLPELTLNLGLRYEGQTFLNDHNNLAPRVGLAWRVPHAERTAIRAGYGVFYSEIRTDLGAGYLLAGPQGIFTFNATPGRCGFPITFGPWASLTALLQSPQCTAANGAATVPQRDITVQLGNATYLNQFFNVAALRSYPNGLVNPYNQQWNLGVEHEFAQDWVLSVDYVGSHSLRLERPQDLNAPAPFIRTAQGQTRSVAAANATRLVQPSATCTTASASFNASSGNCFNNYRQVLAIVNLGSGTYEGLQVKLNKRFSRRFSLLLSYTWSHAIDTVEPDAANQNANDWNLLGADEKATSILDQRHRAALSGWYDLPWGFSFAVNTTLAAGLPFNVTTGTDNNGDGTNADRPVINGAVVPRNFGRGTPTYDVGTSLAKTFRVSDRINVSLRAEAYNLFNHSNFYGRNGTFGNNPTPPATFGAPVGGIVNTGAGRQMQFMARLQF